MIALTLFDVLAVGSLAAVVLTAVGYGVVRCLHWVMDYVEMLITGEWP